MGLIKKVVEQIALESAGDLIDGAIDKTKIALDKAANAVEKKSQKKLQTFLDKNPTHTHLFLAQKRYTLKESFNVYDAEQKIKYVVKGELLSMKHHLHVYDATGKKQIGEVKEKLIALRSPLSMESNPKDFELYMFGKKLGKIKSRFSFGKPKFEVVFKEWSVVGDIMGFKYKVFDGENIVMEVGNKSLSFVDDMYFIDITNPEDELICLLIMLALDSSSSSKVHDVKRTIKRKTLL